MEELREAREASSMCSCSEKTLDERNKAIQDIRICQVKTIQAREVFSKLKDRFAVANKSACRHEDKASRSRRKLLSELIAMEVKFDRLSAKLLKREEKASLSNAKACDVGAALIDAAAIVSHAEEDVAAARQVLAEKQRTLDSCFQLTGANLLRIRKAREKVQRLEDELMR